MPQTSLIPTVLALSDFFSSNFPHISWYPYWYLGNPYHYLIGPVVPLLLMIFNLGMAHWLVYLGLIFFSLPIGGMGIYLLLRDFTVGQKQAILSGSLYMILPLGISLLQFQNGLNHLALATVGYILLLYKKLLQNAPSYFAIFISIFIAFGLLIDISILLPLVIGLISLLISLEPKANWFPQSLRILLILGLGISIATFWYSPFFWWVILTNPSLGGVPLANLIHSLVKFLVNLLPIVLAVLIVKWRGFRPKGYLLFAYLFFASFAFLTLVRFLSDPDFVLDWIGFGLELQFALAILLGKLIWELWLKKGRWALAATFLLIAGGLGGLFLAGKSLFLSPSAFQDRIVSMANDHVKEPDRIFLSGSSVFWINSKLAINQVRGGADESSYHPFWADAVYQIREGTDPKLTKDWLVSLGVSKILVHDEDSAEIFADFKHPEKFTKFNLVKEVRGDKLYQVENASIARLADRGILQIPKPQDGEDRSVLEHYSKMLKKPLFFSFDKPDQMVVKGNFPYHQVASLAITFHPSWQIVDGEGQLLADSLGNLIIIPENVGEQQFKLQFKRHLWEWLMPLTLSFALIILIIHFDKRKF